MGSTQLCADLRSEEVPAPGNTKQEAPMTDTHNDIRADPAVKNMASKLNDAETQKLARLQPQLRFGGRIGLIRTQTLPWQLIIPVPAVNMIARVTCPNCV